MVFFTGYIGEYYGLLGTSWRDPPILQTPSETRTIRGREYLLFYDGDRLRMVALEDRSAPPTGSRTRCSRTSLPRRCWASRAPCQARGDHVARRNRPITAAGMPERAPIGVIGMGWVGLVTAACSPSWAPRLVRGHRRAQDREPARRRRADLRAGPRGARGAQPRAAALLELDVAPLMEHARLLFVCVDTPPTYSGDADLSRVRGRDRGAALVDRARDRDEDAPCRSAPARTIGRGFGELGKGDLGYVSTRSS